MPRRNLRRSFYNNFHGYGSGRRGWRNGAAQRIQRAWRRRKRRNLGLVSRTALANRRGIKKINKQIETLVQSNAGATAVLNWQGQFATGVKVDNRGTDVNGGLPFMAQFCTANQNSSYVPLAGVKGRWIQMKSLTIKGAVSANSDTGSAQYQRMTFVICLDRKPTGTPDQLVATTVNPNTGLLQTYLPTALQNRTSLAFYNLNTTGKDGRYKVLKRFSIVVSPTVDLGNAAGPQNVPAITTVAGGAGTGVVWGNTSRPAYTVPQLGLSKKYPPLVYFSHTIKGKYKFNYGEQGSPHPGIPKNQQIVMFAWSDNGPGLTTTIPSFSYASRFRFKDP